MSSITFTGVCSVNGTVYTRNQLKRLLTPTRIQVRDNGLADTTYASDMAIEQRTAKALTASLLQKGPFPYERFFDDLEQHWFRYDNGGALWRMLSTGHWMWLHNADPGGNVDGDWPLDFVARAARHSPMDLTFIAARNSYSLGAVVDGVVVDVEQCSTSGEVKRFATHWSQKSAIAVREPIDLPAATKSDPSQPRQRRVRVDF